MGVEDDFGIGSIDAIDIAIDFTGFRAQGTGECDGSHIGTAAAECRDFVAVTGALKSGDDDDFAFFEFILNSVGTNGDDACMGVGIVCDDAGLTACIGNGVLGVFRTSARALPIAVLFSDSVFPACDFDTYVQGFIAWPAPAQIFLEDVRAFAAHSLV